MPRRKPTDRLLTEGRDLRNPGRFRGRRGPMRARPLGPPYATMTAPEQALWREMAADMPWLRAHHRLVLRLTCHLAARQQADKLGITGSRLLLTLLGKLGATPVDEPKVALGDDDDQGGADETFFRKGVN